ncbi:MAG: (Fe-S)-binding protein [Sulfolobales archaeon]
MREDRDFIKREVSKCVFCGFCEYECPTISIYGERGYGPRGRIRISLLYLEGSLSKTMYEYIYTCLLCAACVTACPARIDIPAVVAAMRRILANEKIK